MPEGHIEWTQIPKGEKVIDGGNHFQACGKVVFWGSLDALEAQQWLALQARHDHKESARSMSMENQYAERDHEEQGEHYMRHLSAMTGEGLHDKSAIAGELAHRDIIIDQLKGAINKPGVRETTGGAVVIQNKPRSAMLNGIAKYIQTEINAALEHRDKYNNGGEIVVADGVLHRINGYMEQLRIIAKEVSAYEKVKV